MKRPYSETLNNPSKHLKRDFNAHKDGYKLLHHDDYTRSNSMRRVNVVDDRQSTHYIDSDIHYKARDYVHLNRQKKLESKTNKKSLIFPHCTDWHSVAMGQLEPPTIDHMVHRVGVVNKLKLFAQSLLDAEVELYHISTAPASSNRFMETIISSGTLQDKVSALTLAIQESPVHNLKAFQSLLGLASKKNRTQAVGALGALIDLLGPGSLLPPSRKLKFFSSQPTIQAALIDSSVMHWQIGDALPPPLTETTLICFIFEDWLKTIYFKIILLLEAWTLNEVEYCRVKGLEFAYNLLKNKPEQESNLLRLIIDRLEDRDSKVSSRASFLIRQLQDLHPRMTSIIIDAINTYSILDPTKCIRTKYNAVITLNQTILKIQEPNIAKMLLDIYFYLFSNLLENPHPADTQPDSSSRIPQDKNLHKLIPRSRDNVGNGPNIAALQSSSCSNVEKLLSAILTGVNRAMPFVKDYVLQIHTETLFKVAHSSNLNTSIQALLILQKLCEVVPAITDQFYRSLYESLLDPRLVTASKQALYLNLLNRAITTDHDTRRIKAFSKRMLQATDLHHVPFTTGLLYIFSQAKHVSPDIVTLINSSAESFGLSLMHGPGCYDGRNRNPHYSKAHLSALWELEPLFSHYHPAISGASSSIISDMIVMSKPDLGHHTLIKFLDKISFRKPRSTPNDRGGSIMQPRDTTRTGWIGTKSYQIPTVNPSELSARTTCDIMAEDVFYHKYFSHISKTLTGASGQRNNSFVSPNSSLDEDEIWRNLVATQDQVDDDLNSNTEDDEVEFSEIDSSVGTYDISDRLDEDFEDTSDVHPKEPGDLSFDLPIHETSPNMPSNRLKTRLQLLKALPTFASVDDYKALLIDE